LCRDTTSTGAGVPGRGGAWYGDTTRGAWYRGCLVDHYSAWYRGCLVDHYGVEGVPGTGGAW
jgi:hypothetical protein